ncbi:glycosaminoglycan xylosylkinase-like [Liolophura sinensis]|uniref:glycosaminoglycan xylosylkinase-like n=1 Tax=Liolophura sinensis TaxID=3198878 RepID=UPI0031596008
MSLSVRFPNRKLWRVLLAAVALVALLHVLTSDRTLFYTCHLMKDSAQVSQIKLPFPRDNQIESNSSFTQTGLSKTKELEEELNHSNLAEFWETAGHMLGPNGLYPEDFNVSIVLNKMATSKIVSAQGSPGGTSYKWKVRLEGGQYAIFKPQLVEPERERKTSCNTGHEQPRVEIAAFHLMRLFGFRTVPFVAGRKVNITSEILPHAARSVKKFIKTYPDGTACIRHKCFYCKVERSTCFQDGVVDGALMFWLHQPISYRLGVNSSYHPFHQLTFNKSIYNFGVNDPPHCDWVRSMRIYDKPRYFLDLVDMTIMGHVLGNQDEKHVYIRDEQDNPIMTVHIDHGLGMCLSTREVNANKNLAALTQCCRVRESTIGALNRRLPTLREDFERSSSRDRLYPLLTDHQLDAVVRRADEVFEALKKCEEVVDSSVLFDKTN